MPDPPPPSNRALMITLAYLWPLALVPLFLEKHDDEVQWHARHGIVLAIAEFVLLVVVFVVLTTLVSLANVALGCVLALLLVFVWTAMLAVHVIAIVKGINGTRLVVPWVSQYANRT